MPFRRHNHSLTPSSPHTHSHTHTHPTPYTQHPPTYHTSQPLTHPPHTSQHPHTPSPHIRTSSHIPSTQPLYTSSPSPLPNDLLQQNGISSVIISGVIMSPELGAGEGEVPELVNEGPYTLLLCLQPDIVPVTSLGGVGDV